jgi:hypothetical protein
MGLGRSQLQLLEEIIRQKFYWLLVAVEAVVE